jgi:hypothetical protein
VAHALNGFAEARVHDMHNCFIAAMNEKHDVAMAAQAHLGTRTEEMHIP